MKTLTAQDISSLISKIRQKNENINVFVGSGDDKKVLIKKGFKLKHIPSGLVYTVIKVIPSERDGLKILCHRPGKKLLITPKEFKNYERQ